MKNILIILVLGVMSLKVSAAGTGNTNIVHMMMSESYGQVLFIKVSNPPSRSGGHCHTSGSWDYVISTASEFGKQMFSQLLAAHSSQRDVVLSGNDVCNVRATTETLVRIELL